MAKDQLSKAIHEAEAGLAGEWRRTKDVWRDEVATRFANEFWAPLERSIAQYVRVVEELEDGFAEIEREDNR
jgi:hypothetical protein